MSKPGEMPTVPSAPQLPLLPVDMVWRITPSDYGYTVSLVVGRGVLTETEVYHDTDRESVQNIQHDIERAAEYLLEKINHPAVGTWRQNNYGEMVKE